MQAHQCRDRRTGRPAIGIGAQTACEHNARTIIIGKRDVTLCGPCCKDHAFGRDTPQCLTHTIAWGGHVIRDTFHSTVDAMIEGSEHRAATHYPNVWQADQFLLNLRNPIERRGIIQQMVF